LVVVVGGGSVFLTMMRRCSTATLEEKEE